MWEALITAILEWGVTPFGISGWVVAGLLWFRRERERISEAERDRQLLAWMREDTEAKMTAAQAQEGIRTELSGINTRLAVMDALARDRSG